MLTVSINCAIQATNVEARSSDGDNFAVCIHSGCRKHKRKRCRADHRNVQGHPCRDTMRITLAACALVHEAQVKFRGLPVHMAR